MRNAGADGEEAATQVSEEQGLSQVEWAILSVWFSIVLYVVVAIAERWAGTKSPGEFAGYLFLTAVYCIVPYKLQAGSNAARYFHAVVTVLGYAFMAGGVTEGMSKADLWVSVLTLPVTTWAIFVMFSKHGNEWFSRNRRVRKGA